MLRLAGQKGPSSALERLAREATAGQAWARPGQSLRDRTGECARREPLTLASYEDRRGRPKGKPAPPRRWGQAAITKQQPSPRLFHALTAQSATKNIFNVEAQEVPGRDFETNLIVNRQKQRQIGKVVYTACFGAPVCACVEHRLQSNMGRHQVDQRNSPYSRITNTKLLYEKAVKGNFIPRKNILILIFYCFSFCKV